MYTSRIRSRPDDSGSPFFSPSFVDHMKQTESRTADRGSRKKVILELNKHGLNGNLVGKMFRWYCKIYLKKKKKCYTKLMLVLTTINIIL